jgi:GNAT superfamily N-acetyltransferase
MTGIEELTVEDLVITNQNGFLQVSRDGDLLENEGFKNWLSANVASNIASWYGVEDEAPEESIDNDFGEGCNTAIFKLNEQGEVIAYLSGSRSTVEFEDAMSDLSRRGVPCDEGAVAKLKSIFGKDSATVFKTYGFVVDPRYRKAGIGKDLIKEVVDTHDIYYGETRNYSLVRSMSRYAGENNAYLQFGFERQVPEWAKGMTREMSLLIRYFWFENLELLDSLKKTEYRLSQDQLAKYPQRSTTKSVRGKKGFIPLARYAPLHVPSPSWIPVDDQDIKPGDIFKLTYRYLENNPGLYMPRMYVKEPK